MSEKRESGLSSRVEEPGAETAHQGHRVGAASIADLVAAFERQTPDLPERVLQLGLSYCGANGGGYCMLSPDGSLLRSSESETDGGGTVAGMTVDWLQSAERRSSAEGGACSIASPDGDHTIVAASLSVEGARMLVWILGDEGADRAEMGERLLALAGYLALAVSKRGSGVRSEPNRTTNGASPSPDFLPADAVPQIIFISGTDGTTEFINRQWTAYTGQQYEPGLANCAEAAVHHEDLDRLEEGFCEARISGRALEVEVRLRSREGDYRWFLVRAEPYRNEQGEVIRWFGTAVDIHDRSVAEAALRRSEERQAFLLRLSDGLRSLVHPEEVQQEAVQQLGRFLKASRVGYAIPQDDGETVMVVCNYTNAVPSVEGIHRIEEYGSSFFTALSAGEMVLRADVANDSSLSRSERAAYLAMGVAATAEVPVIKNGSLVSILFIHLSEPHSWTQDDTALLAAVAERTWVSVDRATAERALRESEQRYRTIFNSMDEAFSVVRLLYDDEHNVIDALIIDANPVFENQTGLGNPVGKTLKELLPTVEQFWFDLYGEVVRTGQPTRFIEFTASLGRWYDVNAFRIGKPEDHQAAVLFNDVTDRIRREGYARLLAEIAEEYAQEAADTEIMQFVARRAAEHLGVTGCVFTETDPDRDEMTAHSGWQAPGIPTVTGRTYSKQTYVSGEFSRAARAGEIVVVEDVVTDPRTAGRPYGDVGVRSMVAVPYISDSRLRYVMSVTDQRPRQWRDDEVNFIAELGNRVFLRLERGKAMQALRDSEERFRAVVDLVPDLLWQANAEGERTWGNKRWTEYTGQASEDALGEGWLNVLHEADQSRVLQRFRFSVTSGAHYRDEHRIRRADGEYRWFLVEAVPVRDPSGNITRWFGAATDIHEERTAIDRLEDLVIDRTRSLMESEERFRALVMTSAQIVWATDASGRAVEDSSTWRAYTGLPLARLDGSESDGIHPEDVAALAHAWKASSLSENSLEVEVRLFHRPSVSWRWVALRGVPLRDADGMIRGWFGTGKDIEDRKKAEEQLRRMATQLTMAEQEERRRISHILHDDLQQLLYGVQLKLEMIRQDLEEKGADSLVKDLEQAQSWVETGVHTTRQLTVDISPPILHSEGLTGALEWLQRQMDALHGLRVELRSSHTLAVANDDVRVLVFQIVRELLFNVKKHARTTRASVDLRQDGDEYRITVSDEGVGFDPVSLDQNGKEAMGFGLFSARDRLHLLGGSMHIDATPGEGTRVSIHLPRGVADGSNEPRSPR
jgi:PAS domain S-box-containing protein